MPPPPSSSSLSLGGTPPPPVQAAVREVPEELIAAGFSIRNDFVTRDEEALLLREIDSRPWDKTLSRRTQHYGWRFDYRTKSCVPAEAPIPAAFGAVLKRPLPEIPWQGLGRAQCTVNEYEPGQGIAPHVDTHGAFDDGIVALSLGSGTALRVKPFPAGPNDATHCLWLERRSLVTYVGAARYAFTHGIVSRKGDLVDGIWRRRERRVSLTFRHIPSAGDGDGRFLFRRCRCDYPRSCDARPGGPPRLLPTRLPDDDDDDYRKSRIAERT